MISPLPSVVIMPLLVVCLDLCLAGQWPSSTYQIQQLCEELYEREESRCDLGSTPCVKTGFNPYKPSLMYYRAKFDGFSTHHRA